MGYIFDWKTTVTLTFDGLISKSIGKTRQKCVPNLTNLDQFCLVNTWTKFGQFINILMVSVTLTFGRLTLKSTGTIYTTRRISVQNLTIKVSFVSSYHSDKF